MHLFAPFAHLTDPRVQGRCLHQLVDMLALLLCGTLAGRDDLLEVCDYGRARLGFLRDELGPAFANGIPSEDTLERLLRRLNPKEVEQTLRACAGSLAGRRLCVDGKEHRATTPAGRRRATELRTGANRGQDEREDGHSGPARHAGRGRQRGRR